MAAAHIYASDLPLIIKIDGLTNPCGVDVAQNGDIYVADTGANVIKKYNIKGELLATFGSGLNLRNPEGITVSAEGSLYIADTGNNRIIKLKPDGSLNTSFGAKNGILSDNFNLPREVKIDKIGNILIVDSANHRVKRYNLNGSQVKFPSGVNYIGNTGGYSPTGVLSNPYSVAVDNSGNIYIADTYFNRMKIFDSNGIVKATFGGSGEVTLPQGISVNSMNMIFVADTVNHRILKYNQQGRIVDQWGKMGEGDADFFTPAKCVVRTAGIQTYIYIVDPNNNRLQVFDISRFIDDIYLSERYFSPNADGTKDSTIISFMLAGTANVNIDILSGDNVKANVFDGSMSEGYNYVTWEGKDNSGNILPDGRYTYRIVVSSGNYTSVPFMGDIVIDTSSPAIALAIDHAAISPNSDSLNDDCNLSYNITDNLSDTFASVKFQLYKVTDTDNIMPVYSFLNREGESVPAFGSITWDGTIAGNLSEGRYIASLEATDLAGNISGASLDIIVDITPPIIETMKSFIIIFSPNDDGIKDTADISLTLYDNISNVFSVTVGVSEENSEVRVISDSEIKGSGEQHFYWNGRNSSGEVMADGEYTFAAIVRDEAGNSTVVEGGRITVDTIPPVVSDISILPSIFTPDGDGKDDLCRINFNLSENGDVNIEYKNEGGQIYRAVSLRSLEAGSHSYAWNGNSNYQELNEGHFISSIFAEDNAGNSTNLVAGDVFVSLPRYLVTAYASPDVTSNVLQDQVPVQVHYTISKMVSVDAAIYDGTILKKSLISAQGQEKGQYVLPWSGDDNSGSKIKSGSYTYKVQAYDGNISSEAKGMVRVDNDAPAIKNITLDTDEFNPTGSGNNLTTEVNLSYDLSENSNVTIAIYNSSGTLVTNLIEASPKTFGQHTVKWNGEYEQGLVPEGEYTFSISAIDDAGNKTNGSIKCAAKMATITLTNAYNSPNPLTPNSDGIDEFTKINYTLSGGSAYLTAKVKNYGGIVVAILMENDLQAKGNHFIIWDGTKDEMGRPVAEEGTYYYEITANDEKGDELSTISGEMLLVLNPSISFTISPEVISPNGDNKNDYASIICNLNYSSYLTGEAIEYINIYDNNNSLVYSYSETHGRGIYSHKWYGINNQTTPLNVPNGIYNVQVQVVDPANVTVTYNKHVTVSADIPTITIADNDFASPNPFSPNRDGVDETTSLNYSISNISEVSSKEVIIFTSDITFDSTTQVKYIDPTNNIWDGTVDIKGGPGDINGNGYVDPGTYYYKVTIWDNEGNVSSSVSKPFKVQKIILETRNTDNPTANPWPRIFSPNEDACIDTTEIKYRIMSYPEGGITSAGISLKGKNKYFASSSTNPVAMISVKIYDESANCIKTIVSSEEASAGEHSKIWDGTSDDGHSKVPEGKYTIIVSAVNMIDEPTDKNLTLESIVDVTTPQISSVEINPETISPNGDLVNDISELSYNLSERAYITMKLDYPDGSIHTLIDNHEESPGIKSFPWAPDNNLADGLYYFNIDAVDEAGNSTHNDATTSTIKANIDNTPPINCSIHINGDAPFTNLNTVSLALHADDTSGVNNMKFSNDGVTWTSEETYSSSIVWDLSEVEGTKEVYVAFVDKAGNWTKTNIKNSIILDHTPPIITFDTATYEFNPYINPVVINYSISDNYSAGANIASGIYLNDCVTLIKNLPTTNGWKNSGSYTVSWNGLNNNNDYVNEGEYQIILNASDSANNKNVAKCPIKLVDEQRITFISMESTCPQIQAFGNNLHVIWKQKEAASPWLSWEDIYYKNSMDGGKTWSTDKKLSDYSNLSPIWMWEFLNSEAALIKVNGNNIHVVWQIKTRLTNNNYEIFYVRSTDGGFTWTHPVNISNNPADQTSPYIAIDGNNIAVIWEDWRNGMSEVYLTKSINNGTSWSSPTRVTYVTNQPDTGSGIPWTVANQVAISGNNIFISYLKLFPHPPSGGGGFVIMMIVNGGAFYETSSNFGTSWSDEQPLISGNADSYYISNYGSNVYNAWTNGYNYNISKSSDNGGTWGFPVAISTPYPLITSNQNYLHVIGSDMFTSDLRYIRSENNGLSWSQSAHIANTSYPVSISNNGNTAYVVFSNSCDGNQSLFLQKIPPNYAPVRSPGFTTMALKAGSINKIMTGSSTIELISPIDGATVKDLRPTFRWYGLSGLKDYRIECATTSEDTALSGSLDYFTTTISDVGSSKPICEYIVPEHSMGLDESDSSRPFWYWRVKTANTSEVTTSEVGSFKIDLPLSLSGVTNWPNPFDPNSEKTKIRYRLGREPDSVTIRIYDITGALVREMDGTCNAEGASIWNKYNDVEWDGRNGRGDIVLNGVYPFEVIVEGGNKTVSGRGKIVVLK